MKKMLLAAGALAAIALPALAQAPAAQPQAIDPKTVMLLEMPAAELDYLARALDSHNRAHGAAVAEDVAYLLKRLKTAKPKPEPEAPPAPAPKK